MKSPRSTDQPRSTSMPLRWKLILAFAALALLSIASAGIYTDVMARELIRDAARDDLQKAAKRTALQIDSYIMSQLDGIRTEAQQPALAEYLELPPAQRPGSLQEREAQQTLVIFSRKDPVFINSYALLDNRGINLLDTEERQIGVNESGYEYFTHAFTQGLPFVSTLIFQEEVNFFISAPVRDEQGEIIGVLRAEYDAVVFQSKLLAILPEKGTGNFISIIDLHSYIRIADTGGTDNLYKSLRQLSAPEIATLQERKLLPPGAPESLILPSSEFVEGIEHLAGSPFFEAYSDSIREEAFITSTPLKSLAWVVVEGRSQKTLSQPIQELRRNMMRMGFVLLTIAAFLALIMSLVIIKPVINLTSVAKRIATGDLDAVAPVLSNDEAGTLAQAFNSMTEKLRQTLAGLQEELRERKQAQDALRESEERFRKVFHSSPVAICITTLEDGRLLEANYAYWDLTGYDSETSIGKDAQQLQMWDVPDERAELVKNLRSKRSIYNPDDYFYHTDGTIRHVISFYELIRLGNDDCILAMFYDMSAQKKTMQALQESEARTRALLEAIPDLIFEFDADGTFLKTVPPPDQSLFVAPEQFLGKKISEVVPQAVAEQTISAIQRVLQDRKLETFEYQIPMNDGVREYETRVVASGAASALAIVRDVTQRKWAETERERFIAELKARNQESEALRESLASIVGTLKFEEIIQRILAQIKQVIPYDTASVWRYESGRQIIIAGVDLPPEIKIPGTILIVDEMNSAYPILKEQVPYVLSNNVQAELPDFTPPHDYIHSWLAIPLKTRGRVIGLIALDGKNPNQFSQRHAELAVTYANQVAIALDNASLFDELQNELNLREDLIAELELKNAEAETLRESLASVVGTFELSEIIARMLDQIQRVIPYDSASIWRLQGRKQILIGERNLPAEIAKAGLEFDLDEDNHAMPIFKGERAYVISANVQAEFPRFTNPPHNYINSWLGVPLKVRGAIVGLIALDGRAVRQFNDHHAQLAVTFADQVAIALENARLFSDLQDELRKQTALRSASMSISSSLQLNEVLGEICKQMCVVNDSTSAYIAEYDREYASYITVAEYVGGSANAKERVSDIGVRYYRSEGAWLFDENINFEFKIIYSDDQTLTPWMYRIMNEYGGRSILFIPLYVQGRLLGHTELWDSRLKRNFSKEEISFCRTLSQQAAIAIANAKLFQQLQNELRERKNLIEELEAKNSELERFTYTVSHDLKSPLFTIRGFLGYLEQDALAGNRERLQSDMQRITDATEKMQRLLNDLLELSRIGRLKNESTPIPFEKLAHDAVALVQGHIMQRGITVHINTDMPTVHGDQPRLLEVLQNLVDNAAKFMGNQPEPRIEIGQRGEENGMPVFFVRDNGVGVAAEHHERIFGLFNKLDVKSDGTGIGLALVKRIIEVHGGRIWVESEAGHGSTFYFSLPRA